jgi:hypothetical protein
MMLRIRPPRVCVPMPALRDELEPVARSALRAADLGIAHLLRNFAAQLRCLLVTAHRSNVEPLVSLHEVNRDACSR